MAKRARGIVTWHKASLLDGEAIEEIFPCV